MKKQDLESIVTSALQESQYVFFIYILECADQSFYTGITNNLLRRYKEHQQGKDEFSYTSSRRPVVLRHFEVYHDVFKAIAREKQLKKWSRKKKESLITNEIEELIQLAKCTLRKKKKHQL